MEQRITRRGALKLGAGAAGAIAALPGWATASPLLAPPGQMAPLLDELTIDLTAEPPALDPATTYEVEGWSIVHSIYDSLLQFGPNGELEMLLAESYQQLDPTTVEIKLRPGITFHNGEPVEVKAVETALAHIRDEQTASSIAGNFAAIDAVEVVDLLTLRFVLSRPAPWLPAQIAPWLLPPPPVSAAGGELGHKPVGTGPYRFVEWAPGERIVLEANPSYFPGSPKGTPVASRVVFRFVSEPSTRVADLLSGTAQIVRGVPVDQIADVEEGGATVRATPVVGTTFVRIPTDVAPFSDVRVRQALNYAVDVPAIIEALLGGHGTPLASPFVAPGLGYDPELAPYERDLERARALLTEAGYPDGFDTRLAYSALERGDLIEALAAQLDEAGVRVAIERQEPATFNQQWQDQSAAPLRFVSWRPMYDPFTLLNLVFSNAGFLSRHDNPRAQELMDAAANEIEPETRAERYRQLARVLHDEPGAIYLWSLTALYGVAAEVPAWSTRADDYIIPTARADS